MKPIIAVGLLLGTAVSANAADLAARPYTKAPPMTAAIYDWTGFYVGVNGGYGLGRNRLDFAGATRFETIYGQPRGGFGGGQIGYNWQTGSSFLGLGNLVLGVEADIQGADQRDVSNLRFTSNGDVSQRTDWFGTVRGRVGLATGPMLTYVTGGYAVANVRTDATTPFGVFPAPFVGGVSTLSTNRTVGGWTIGSGVEAALWGNWTGKIEYLYMDLGNRTDGLTGANTGEAVRTQYRDQVFRVGLNYRLNGNEAARPWVVPAAANWTGFYIGGNAGGATGRDRTSLTAGTVVPNALTENFNLSPDGYLGGIQGGYNWQASNWVFGIEADYQISSQRDNRTTVFSGTPTFSAAYNQRLPELGTARGRIGYAAGPSLFYVTGGYAYGRVRTDVAFTSFAGGGFPTTTTSLRRDRDGYTVGGGIETPFTFLGLFGPSWTTKTEYLYVDLGRQTDTFVANGTTLTNSTRVTEHVFRTGLNYHFNSPVVAKY